MPFTNEDDEKIARAFNEKPKNGIQEIQELCATKQGIEHVEKQIASFFIRQKDNLDLKEVGDYLGTGGEPNRTVLNNFTKELDFKGKNFVESYREYLSNFHLPGEAQKIDRIVESFGKSYKEQNPESPIADKDAAYVLAFSVTMLNSDLHNPSVKNHMTYEQFVKNNKGINNTKDFDSKFLKTIYDDIKNNEIKTKFNPIAPGYEFDSNNLNNNKTFKKLLNTLSKSKVKTEDLPAYLEDAKITTTKAKSWLNKITGYKGTVTIKHDNSEAKVEIYEPGIFSKYFKRKHPKVIVVPSNATANSTREGNLNLAASISSSLGATPTHIKATYDYEKKELKNAYDVRVIESKIINKPHLRNNEVSLSNPITIEERALENIKMIKATIEERKQIAKGRKIEQNKNKVKNTVKRWQR